MKNKDKRKVYDFFFKDFPLKLLALILAIFTFIIMNI